MKKPNKNTALATSVAVLVASIAELSALPVKELGDRFVEKSAVSRSAFAEMGKIHRCMSPKLKKGQTIYGELRKLGVKDSTISNASYAAKTIEAFVEPGLLTEADYDGMTFADHYLISKAMGDKSAAPLDAESVAAIITGKPTTWDDELKSIIETGMDIAEATAQAEQAVADAATAKKAEDDAKIAAAAKKLADEAEQKRQADEAAKAAAQSTPPVSTASTTAPAATVTTEAPTAPTAAPAAPVNESVPGADDATAPVTSHQSPVTTPPAAPVAQTEAPPSNVSTMPPAATKATLQECMDTCDLLEMGVAELSDEDAETVFHRIAEINSALAERLQGAMAKAA